MSITLTFYTAENGYTKVANRLSENIKSNELGGPLPHKVRPSEAPSTATRLPAEHQGVDKDLGTLESGKLADMVFVEGNPLERIEDTMQVKMTMKNGELFTIGDLVGPFSSE
ncbi:amidohydrolase family protein [Halalkalicoccus salilacus]|uniref:amidohydrolase family protein n=1 Tax=Halalkalicoccus TaxID=332246 RepID=UPI002F96E4BF